MIAPLTNRAAQIEPPQTGFQQRQTRWCVVGMDEGNVVVAMLFNGIVARHEVCGDCDEFACWEPCRLRQLPRHSMPAAAPPSALARSSLIIRTCAQVSSSVPVISSWMSGSVRMQST